jgi:hypothetical protein
MDEGRQARRGFEAGQLKTIVWQRDAVDDQPRTVVAGGAIIEHLTRRGVTASMVALTALSVAAEADPSPISIGVRGFLLGLKLALIDPELAADTLAAMRLSAEELGQLRAAAAWVVDRAGQRDN